MACAASSVSRWPVNASVWTKLNRRRHAATAASRPDSQIGSGNTVMIVEDEALVALSLQDFLCELGYSVVGPFGRVKEALTELDRRSIDAAILDVNLAGEFVYPLAELLRKRKIPFVFATGYSAESIDQRFAEISVLQKPIDRQTLEIYFSQRNGLPLSEVDSAAASQTPGNLGARQSA
jgi:two-component SAPR family response regulator